MDGASGSRNWLPHIPAETVLDAIGDAVIVTDEAGNVRTMNPAARDLLACPLRSYRGRPLSEILNLVDDRTSTAIHYPIDECLHHGKPVTLGAHTLLKRNTGVEIPVEDRASPVRDHRGAVIGAVLVLRNAIATRNYIRSLVHDASHDSLTCLVNRHEFERRLERVLHTAKAGEAHVVLYMDLDGFKKVNDRAGHLTGDAVLRQVACRLQTHVRERDTLARWGGDEFVLLMEHCPLWRANAAARQMRADICRHIYHCERWSFRLDISVGLAEVAEGRTVEEVLALADQRCYEAKRSRLGEVHRASPSRKLWHRVVSSAVHTNVAR
jgi:diguanylate cyclase (GGDEF)-like protein/PAS domain S-box-containing protein